MHLASELAGPLRRITVQSGHLSIKVEWQQAAEASATPQSSPASMTVPAQAPVAPGPATAEAGAENEVTVTSPMVGTFYRAPSPDAAPFVDVGDLVEPGQTVAIIEAMKLFNPITAEHAGIVAAVLAESGRQVEFGQPLLRIAATEVTSLGVAGKD
jgi:acetyl-CoA carboxylase biotin carboxyl carrier protein